MFLGNVAGVNIPSLCSLNTISIFASSAGSADRGVWWVGVYHELRGSQREQVAHLRGSWRSGP